MKKKDYNNYFDEIELSKKESNIIKDNIINKSTPRRRLKPVYIVALIIICGIGLTPVTASVIKSNFILYNKNNPNPHSELQDEEHRSKSVYITSKLNNHYSNDIVNLNEDYKLNELEKKLGIVFLKNNKIDMESFKVNNKETVGTSTIGLALINNDKQNKKIELGIIFYTKEDIVKERKLIGMQSKKVVQKEYYINSLKTKAIIMYNDIEPNIIDENQVIYTTPFMAVFEKDNIIYSIYLEGQDGYTLEKLYEILESFYS